MRSRSSNQRNSKNGSSSAKSSGGVGKKLRRISISDDSDGNESSDEPTTQLLPEFLDLFEFDLTSKCPTLKSVCERDASHFPPLNADELDAVQIELEKLLFFTISRTKSIKDALQDLNDGHVASSSTTTLASTSNRSSHVPLTVECSKRTKMKYASASAEPPKRSASAASLSPLKIKPLKHNKNEHVTTSERSALSPGSSRLYLWPQNQMPDKFVDFVDTYAGGVDSELLSKLKELANESDPSKSSSYYIFPELGGKHLSSKMSAVGASAKSPTESSKNFNKSKKANASSTVNNTKKQKNGEITTKNAVPAKGGSKKGGKNSSKSMAGAAKVDDQCSLGPLTERLVQALIEENGFESPFVEEDCQDASPPPDDPTTNDAVPSKNLVKSLSLGNMAALERRIRKELEEQGLLEFKNGTSASDTELNGNSDDEVAAELKMRQKELLSLQKSNHERLTSIIQRCKKALERQKIEDRLKHADNHILDLYGRFYGVAPISRKPSTKKEKDQLWKSLSDRDKIVDELKLK